MLLVLDTNEYVFSLGAIRNPFCEKLLEEISLHTETITVRITRLIVDEVRNNLTLEAFKEFIIFINTLTKVDEDFVVPFELGSKYEAKGFKSADAFIAAYTEWTGSNILVSENRHFLSQHSDLPFKVLTAEKCLKVIK